MQHVAARLHRFRKEGVEEAVAGALDEVHARHHRITFESGEVELQRAIHQAVNHQDMRGGIELGPPAVMDLEVQPARGDGAAQMLQRRSGKAVFRRELVVELKDGSLDMRLLFGRHPVPPHRQARNPGPFRQCGGRLCRFDHAQASGRHRAAEGQTARHQPPATEQPAAGDRCRIEMSIQFLRHVRAPPPNQPSRPAYFCTSGRGRRSFRHPYFVSFAPLPLSSFCRTSIARPWADRLACIGRRLLIWSDFLVGGAEFRSAVLVLPGVGSASLRSGEDRPGLAEPRLIRSDAQPRQAVR